MKVWSLGSGSSGNAIVIESRDTRVLVDAGFPAREIARRMESIEMPPESISALVVTHEHNDHARGVAGCMRRWGWDLLTTRGTAAACKWGPEFRHSALERGGATTVGDVQLQAVAVPHDALEPFAVVATSITTGERSAVVYDLGTVTDDLRQALDYLDVLVVEANHDDGMLRTGPYPPVVQRRICGRHGHLSNRSAARLAARCTHRGLGHVVLAHLSESCNLPEVALATVSESLGRAGFRGSLSVARQDRASGPYLPRLNSVRRGEQLALHL